MDGCRTNDKSSLVNAFPSLGTSPILERQTSNGSRHNLSSEYTIFPAAAILGAKLGGPSEVGCIQIESIS